MKKSMQILLAAVLIAAVFTKDRICEHLGFGQTTTHDEAPVDILAEPEEQTVLDVTQKEEEEEVNDETTIYRWDEEYKDWVVDEELQEFQVRLVENSTSEDPPPTATGPIEVDWRILMDIQYKLQYFKELEVEMYAPVFSKAVKALHKKEVIIEGYVIPFDEEGKLLALSFNPYASCFFCGKASPASVLSMHLKDDSKRYKTDDFRKFKGKLHLNHDDPNEFYYILRNAEPI